MNGLYILGFIVLCICFFSIKSSYRRQEEASESEETVATEQRPMAGNTRSLVMRVLKEMGCDYEVDENGHFRFNFQGGQFFIESHNEYTFINVYAAWWHCISMDADIEEFARMQKAVNLINGWANCTVLYTMNHEERLIGVHLKKNMLFIPEIPELKGYLEGTLIDFFRTQRELITEMEKIKVREEQV